VNGHLESAVKVENFLSRFPSVENEIARVRVNITSITKSAARSKNGNVSQRFRRFQHQQRNLSEDNLPNTSRVKHHPSPPLFRDITEHIPPTRLKLRYPVWNTTLTDESGTGVTRQSRRNASCVHKKRSSNSLTRGANKIRPKKVRRPVIVVSN